jgi:tetratricopeptide (TPR) repeat protein
MALFGRKDDPKKLWEQFFKMVLKYDWDKALDLLNSLKELEPQNAQVHIKLAEVLQRKGDKSRAVAAYHKAARFLVDMINMQKALAIYKLILRLNPSDNEAIERSRELMQELGMAPSTGHASPAEPAQKPSARKGRSLEEALAAHPVFSVLSAGEARALTEKAKHLKADAGQDVIKENEPGDSVFIIKNGTAKVSTNMLGQLYDLAVLGEGDFFGEIGFLSGMPRTATVTAVGPMEVLEIDRDLLSSLIDMNPQVLERLAETSRMRTQDTLDKIQGDQE